MSVKDQVSCLGDDIAVTIAAGAALSDEINLGGLRLFQLDMPSAVTGTVVTFQKWSATQQKFLDMTDSYGSEISVTVAADKSVGLPDIVSFSAASRLKIRFGTSAAPVVQAAARTLGLVLRSV